MIATIDRKSLDDVGKYSTEPTVVHAHLLSSTRNPPGINQALHPDYSDRETLKLAQAIVSHSVLQRSWFSHRVSPQVASAATIILAALWQGCDVHQAAEGYRLVPQFFPLEDGGLQMEWHAGNRHLEVAFDADGYIGVVIDSELGTYVVDVDPMRVPIPVMACRVLAEVTERVWQHHRPANRL